MADKVMPDRDRVVRDGLDALDRYAERVDHADRVDAGWSDLVGAA